MNAERKYRAVLDTARVFSRHPSRWPRFWRIERGFVVNWGRWTFSIERVY